MDYTRKKNNPLLQEDLQEEALTDEFKNQLKKMENNTDNSVKMDYSKKKHNPLLDCDLELY